MTWFSGRAIGFAIGGGMVAMAGAAHAQPAATAADPGGQVASPPTAGEAAGEAAPAAPADDGRIQEITVTARRRNESIQTTPVAVSAISPSILASKASFNITELQGAAPGVLITRQATGAATANISIRGIAFADVEKSFDPAVGINVDGVYIGTSTGQLLDFFDIASIEILRGPQGTLFGRNTIAGVINVRRTRPTGEWGLKAEASIGSYGQIGLRGALNVPVIEGLLAAKLFEFHQESDGFYKDNRGGKHVGGDNQENFGGSFLLTPSSSFNALLTLEEQKQSFDPIVGSLIRPGDIFCPLVAPGACGGNSTTDIYTAYPGNTPSFGRYRARAATLEMNLTGGPVKLTSVSSYRESKEDIRQNYATAGLYDVDRAQTYRQFSEELRASGNLFPKFDYVAGVYFFDSRYRALQATNFFGAFAGLQDTKGRSRSEAAFVDLNWEFLPKLRLSGGGRFTHDRKKQISPLLIGPNGEVGARAKDSWSRFTPRVTLDYRPNTDVMVYASWSRGYRSGGFNGRAATYVSATTPYDPESVDSYEVGFKSEFLDRAVSFNVAAYYTDYKNIQQSTTVTVAASQGEETIVTNAAGAHIKGIEAELTARPIQRLTLSGTAGYTDARFHGFVVDQPVFGVLRTFDFSKVDLIYAPKLTASFNVDYKVPLSEKADLVLNAGYRYVTRYDQQIAADPATPIPAAGTIVVQRNDPRLRSDRQNLVDASVAVTFAMDDRGAKARFAVFGRNLLDDRGPATGFNVAAFPTLWSFAAAREPRVIGASFGFEF